MYGFCGLPLVGRKVLSIPATTTTQASSSWDHETSRRVFSLGRGTILFRGVFTLGVGGPTHHIFAFDPTRGYRSHLIETRTGAKSRISMDDVKNGLRINCNGVHGTVIGKRSTRNQRFVLAKMDNGFTLKLKADALLAELPETAANAQLIDPAKQLASVD